MLNLYQEILMDHYRNPRNSGTLEQPNFCAEQRNSSCGDEVIFMGIVRDNILVDVAFQGKGCVVSQATASILSEQVKNKTLDVILVLDKDDLIAMLGMSLGPVRLLCALLSLTALQNGVREYKARNT
jgi:nitrogen fixation protein NifU and related proteins